MSEEKGLDRDLRARMRFLLWGEQTDTFTFNLTSRMHEALRYMASVNGMNRGPYVRILLANALAREGMLELEITDAEEKVIK